MKAKETKKVVVLFTPLKGARIFINPKPRLRKRLNSLGTVVENPDLRAVRGLPPEFWAYDKKRDKVVRGGKLRKTAVTLNMKETGPSYAQMARQELDLPILRFWFFLAIAWVVGMASAAGVYYRWLM